MIITKKVLSGVIFGISVLVALLIFTSGICTVIPSIQNSVFRHGLAQQDTVVSSESPDIMHRAIKNTHFILS